MATFVPNENSDEIRENFRSSSFSSLNDRKVSIREVAAGLLIAAGLYLLNGEYAATACTMLTSVPAAAFTYKVLTHSEVSKQGYRSILFYWTVQGGMCLLDYALDDSYGYFLGKFVLLAAVFGNAATKNKDVFERIISVEGLKTEITQCVTSIVTLYDSEGYPVNSPPPTAFSEDFVDTPPLLHPRRSCAIHSDTDEVSMMSTQRNTSPPRTYAINRALTPHPMHVEEEFADAAESEATVAAAYGDIVTNPMQNVVFGAEDKIKSIMVVNVSGENAMWALKCNALHRLGATPACGIIASGGTQEIRIVLNGMKDSEYDKLAIDYALVGNEKAYSPLFFQRPDKKRHLLRIHYL